MRWLLALLMALAGMGAASAHAEECSRPYVTPMMKTYAAYDYCLSSRFHGGEECNTGDVVANCMSRAARCLYAAVKNDGDKLAKLYRELVGGLHIGDRKAIPRLRISQRAWLKYHKAQCDIRKNHTPYFDPDARLNRFEHARCQLLSTKRRLWELLDEYVHHADDWHNQK